MCQQRELAERASKCLRANKAVGGPPLKGFESVVEAIKSNEPNNLAKAARVLAIYEENLRQLLLQKKQEMQQKDKTPPPKPIKLPITPPQELPRRMTWPEVQ